MLKLSLIFINVLAVILLFGAQLTDDNQIHNYIGGFYAVFAAWYLLRAGIMFWISEGIKAPEMYALAREWQEYDWGKSPRYNAIVGFVCPAFSFVGLCALSEPGLAGFYIIAILVARVGSRHLAGAYRDNHRD